MRRRRSGAVQVELKIIASLKYLTFVLRELVMDVMQEKLKGQFSELEAGKGKQ